MKKSLSFVLMGLILTFSGCANFSSSQAAISKTHENSSIPFPSESDNSTSLKPEIARPEYNEEVDSLEGVDATDLSALKEKFDSITNNYTIATQSYFNNAAVEIINDIYETNYIQGKTTLVVENGHYTYDEDGYTNELYINRDDRIYVTSLKGDTIEDKITSTLDTTSLTYFGESNYNDYFFNFNDLNGEYIDTYGPTTVKYTNSYSVDYLGWTRVSNNKYKCDRVEVVDNFRQLLTPGLSNAGTYMTYKYVTVEINEDSSLRIRLYCNTTQSGKVIKEHKEQENKPNWYMLLAEGIVSDINTTSLPVLDNL